MNISYIEICKDKIYDLLGDCFRPIDMKENADGKIEFIRNKETIAKNIKHAK